MWPAEWEVIRSGAIDAERFAWIWIALVVVGALAAAALIRGPTQIRVPDAKVRRAGRPRIDLPWLLSLTLRLGALGLILLTLARPMGLLPENPAGGRGIDFVIALDTSGSMKALDAILGGQRVTRLELAKQVVSDSGPPASVAMSSGSEDATLLLLEIRELLEAQDRRMAALEQRLARLAETLTT